MYMYMHILSSSQHTFAEIIGMIDHIDLPISVCLAVLALLVVAVWLEGVEGFSGAFTTPPNFFTTVPSVLSTPGICPTGTVSMHSLNLLETVNQLCFVSSWR